jgi:hypothetical protein
MYVYELDVYVYELEIDSVIRRTRRCEAEADIIIIISGFVTYKNGVLLYACNLQSNVMTLLGQVSSNESWHKHLVYNVCW